jgi:hypothetical protein
MYKMLFNTGVKPENHCYLSGARQGQLIIGGQYEEWRSGTLHIAYYLESKPPEGWVVKHLCYSPEVGELYMPIVGGGMLSKYAVFTFTGKIDMVRGQLADSVPEDWED